MNESYVHTNGDARNRNFRGKKKKKRENVTNLKPVSRKSAKVIEKNRFAVSELTIDPFPLAIPVYLKWDIFFVF